MQGRVAATIGVGGNTGYMQWVIPRSVREGVYYLVIGPLNGSRRLEVRNDGFSLKPVFCFGRGAGG